MKSITQEASSVLKAIEKAWEAAGKPKEFSIKVFEEPKKNFIGMTVQSAKIGIFFDEKNVIEQESYKEAPLKKRDFASKQQPKKEAVHPPVKSEKSEIYKPLPKINAKPQGVKETREGEKQQKIVWTPEMITLAEQWLTKTLAAFNTSIPFSIETSQYQLLITFSKSLIANTEKEQQLLRSLSLLLIQTLRHALKRPLRGFKIIMTRGQ